MRSARGARWRALAALLRADRARWLLLTALVVISSVLALTGPLVVRRIVDDATDGTTTASVTRLALLYLSIAIGMQVLAIVVAWYATLAAWQTTNRLRMQMARHVLGLDHEFHRTHTPGELIQRVDGDVTSVSDFLGLVVPKAAGAVLLIAGMVAVLFVLDWRVALGTVVYLALSLAVVVRSRHRAVTESADEMGALARLFGGIEERLTAAEDLRSNGAAEHVAWRFIEDSTEAMSTGVRRERAFLVMWWFVQSVVSAGWVLVLVVGSILVAADAITVGTAFLLFQYVLLVSRPLEEVVHQLETVQKANGAMVRVIDLLAVRAQIVDAGTVRPHAGPLEVEFRSVDFEYDGAARATADSLDEPDSRTTGQPVLHDIDLVFGAGRSVGVVGRTGSGKTTMSRLVLRLVEASSGEVLIGGVPIADIPMDELRRRVALVPQEVELFAGTVRDNVTLFDDRPTDAAVTDALVAVGLGALAAAGTHRALGVGGAGLSAGEAQLLALARVWLRDPDVVVLDEATSRVDPDTERRIEEAIARLISTRTALVIAHRLSTLRAVDDIVVLEQGRVTEAGPRADLVADDESRFSRLLELALDGAVADEVSTDSARSAATSAGATP